MLSYMNIACVKGNLSNQDPSVQIYIGEIPVLIQDPHLIRWECIQGAHKMHDCGNRWVVCVLNLVVIARCMCVYMCALVCVCVCVRVFLQLDQYPYWLLLSLPV